MVATSANACVATLVPRAVDSRYIYIIVSRERERESEREGGREEGKAGGREKERERE